MCFILQDCCVWSFVVQFACTLSACFSFCPWCVITVLCCPYLHVVLKSSFKFCGSSSRLLSSSSLPFGLTPNNTFLRIWSNTSDSKEGVLTLLVCATPQKAFVKTQILQKIHCSILLHFTMKHNFLTRQHRMPCFCWRHLCETNRENVNNVFLRIAVEVPSRCVVWEREG